MVATERFLSLDWIKFWGFHVVLNFVKSFWDTELNCYGILRNGYGKNGEALCVVSGVIRPKPPLAKVQRFIGLRRRGDFEQNVVLEEISVQI